MNKSGKMVLMLTIEIIVVVLVSFLIFDYVTDLANGSATAKKIVANDMAMMIDAMVGTPGDAIVRYPHDVSEFSFFLGGSAIKVRDSEVFDAQGQTRRIHLPVGYVATGTVEPSGEKGFGVCLEKVGQKVTIRECEEYES